MATNIPTTNAEQPGAPSASATAPGGIAPAAPNGTQAADEAVATSANANDANLPMPEAKVATRKDASLKEFLNKMDEYAPIVCHCPLHLLLLGLKNL